MDTVRAVNEIQKYKAKKVYFLARHELAPPDKGAVETDVEAESVRACH